MKTILFLFFPFLAFAQTTQLNDGLLAHFNFDKREAESLAHSYPNGNEFAANTLRKQAGQVLVLNGQNQHLALTNGFPKELLGTQEKMIICWVYPAAVAGTSFLFLGPPTEQYERGATLGWVTNARGEIGVDISHGLRFTSIRLKANEWNLVYLHFREGVFEIGKVKAEGIERATITDLNYHNLQPGVAMIGGNVIHNRYFMGAMDDIRLYNRRLNDCELLQLWQGSKRGLKRSGCQDSLVILNQQAQAIHAESSAQSPKIDNYPSEIVDAVEDIEIVEEKILYESEDKPSPQNSWETSRLTPEIREVLRRRESLFTTSKVIRIAVFDARTPDGDAVDLHFNGQLLAENIVLRQQPQEFTARLVDGINAVRINLAAKGDYGSNSCLVKVNDGRQTYYLSFPDYRAEEATLTIVKD